jgi:ribonuclease P protein component
MAPDSAEVTGAKSPDLPRVPCDQRFGRRQRLVSSKRFDEAFGQGRKYVGRLMIMFLRSGEGASFRLGVVTSRKVGESHVRSLARRRLREVFRRNRARLRGDFDALLLARAGVDRAPWADVVKDFLSLAKRAGILSND